MIHVEDMEVWGCRHAIRGMRNPMNSWEKSDSGIKPVHTGMFDDIRLEFVIGENDLDLMRRLYKGGSEHRKYLRQIFVSMDITAPLYWWKEFDTYKVGTVANSCSTMHKIHSKEFTLDDFSCEHLIDDQHMPAEAPYNVEYEEYSNAPLEVLEFTIKALNVYRELYIKTNDKKYWWQMIQLLPSSYNQRRTVTMNYENVINIIHQRKNHKLDEWQNFVEVLEKLDYVKDIVDSTGKIPYQWG